MNCSYYYFFDVNNNYQCTKNLSCPPEYSLLIPNKNECVLEGIKGIEKLIDDIFNSETNELLKRWKGKRKLINIIQFWKKLS